ncbi:MAG: LCP family protein [Oscillospiraceae bacterium]|nr:LCP family protein [Oscillospiraceae bacterium]MCL2279388.1 LCP family protein [Oscillospiraceae bacterium]
MKLIGSRGNGRRVANGKRANSGAQISATHPEPGAEDGIAAYEKIVGIIDSDIGKTTPRSRRAGKRVSAADTKAVPNRKAKLKKRLIITGGVLLFIASAVMLVLFTPLWDALFRPGEDVLAMPAIFRPSIDTENPDRPPVDSQDNLVDDGDPEVVPTMQQVRSVDQLTFLILGIDGTGNTDVVMVAKFDYEEATFEVVNIPRDTMVNVSWNVRKVNSIHAVMRNRYRNEDNPYERAMEETVGHFRNILGFDIDFWATINMRAFINLIDAIGGVQFDVPVNMNWRDPEANLHFQLSRGPQRVNGNNALGLMRYRGYGTGDFGRINVQQDFLLAAAQQLLAGVNAGNISTFVDTFLNHVTTNIQMNHLAWLGREFIGMDIENINFTTMPTRPDRVRGISYVRIELDEWLEIVNTRLSPLHTEITSEDVSILTRGTDRRLFVTDGNWLGSSSWG